jgi:hypothetical protein
LMCSKRKASLCGPSSSSSGVECTRGFTWTGNFEALPKSSKRSTLISKGTRKDWFHHLMKCGLFP